MKSYHPFLFALSFGLLVLILTVGGLLGAFAENSIWTASTPLSSSPTPPLATFTYFPSPSPSSTPTRTPTPAPTQLPCQPPVGWTAVVVQSGDTIVSFASNYQISPEVLAEANCLLDEEIFPGWVLFVPVAIPISTRAIPTESEVCVLPDGWVEYTVLSGDTLFQLSDRFDITVEEIQNANCMGESTQLQTGSVIYLPDRSP